MVRNDNCNLGTWVVLRGREGGREGELWPDSPLSCCRKSQQSGQESGDRRQELIRSQERSHNIRTIPDMEEFDQIQTAEFREAFDEFDKVCCLLSLFTVSIESLDKYHRGHCSVFCLFMILISCKENIPERSQPVDNIYIYKGRQRGHLLQGASLRYESDGTKPNRG